jgi:hypothetical protein
MPKTIPQPIAQAYAEQLTCIGVDLVRHGIITRRAARRDGIRFAVKFTLNGRYRMLVEAGTLPATILPILQRKSIVLPSDRPRHKRVTPPKQDRQRNSAV